MPLKCLLQYNYFNSSNNLYLTYSCNQSTHINFWHTSAIHNSFVSSDKSFHKIVIKFIWTEGELLVRITKEYKVANMQDMLIAVCLSPSRRSQSIEIDLTN